MDIGATQSDAEGTDVLLQTRQLGCTRDRRHPRLLGKQPGECYLSRCRLFLLREFSNQINQGPIRLTVLRREPRDSIAKIRLVELRRVADLAGEKAFAQRAEWDEADAEFLQCRYDFRFGLSPPERIFTLECRDRLDCV